MAGVAGVDRSGVTGRKESVAESAGEGGIMRPGPPEGFATRGEGASMGAAMEVGVGSLTDDEELAISGL